MQRLNTIGQFTKPIRILISCAIVLWALFSIFPLYWTIITSIKQQGAVNQGATYLPWIEFTPDLHAWREVFSGGRGNFGRNLINSLIVSFSAAVASTILGSMAAYALLRYRFKVQLGSALIFLATAVGVFGLLDILAVIEKLWSLVIAFFAALAASIWSSRLKIPGPIFGNQDVVFWFVSQRMFPPIVTTFALYLMYVEFDRNGFELIDSYLGLTLCYIAFVLPIVVWLMRDFLAAVPAEVEEAALIDDIPLWRIFLQIVLPLTLPGFIATFMIALSFVWNEFLLALILTNADWQTLPILVSGQSTQSGDEWWSISVAILIAIGPMMLMAWVLARMMQNEARLGLK